MRPEVEVAVLHLRVVGHGNLRCHVTTAERDGHLREHAFVESSLHGVRDHPHHCPPLSTVETREVRHCDRAVASLDREYAVTQVGFPERLEGNASVKDEPRKRLRVVDLLEAVHDRAALERDASPVRLHALVALYPLNRHRELKLHNIAGLPCARDTRIALAEFGIGLLPVYGDAEAPFHVGDCGVERAVGFIGYAQRERERNWPLRRKGELHLARPRVVRDLADRKVRAGDVADAALGREEMIGVERLSVRAERIGKILQGKERARNVAHAAGASMPWVAHLGTVKRVLVIEVATVLRD